MDERRALMAAIIADPDEDTPRLVFADWLQEHGDEHDRARAEFIRLQVQAARLPEGDPERKKLEKAAGKLATRHHEAWLAALASVDPGLIPADHHLRPFARGLLKFLFFDTGKFLQKAYQQAIPDALAATGVEEACFYSPTKRVAALAASPALRWVARVQYPGADDAALAEFGRSPNLAHISGLGLDELKATDAGLSAFAKTSGTVRLRAVELTCGGGLTSPRGKYTAAGVLAVLGSPRFPLLDSLDLEGDQPVKFDYRALLADPGLGRLTRLRLGSDVPMDAVAACRHLTALRELAVNSGNITDADAGTLLANPALANLTTLEMYGMNWGHPRLSKAAEKRLRDRFGREALRYSPEQR